MQTRARRSHPLAGTQTAAAAVAAGSGGGPGALTDAGADAGADAGPTVAAVTAIGAPVAGVPVASASIGAAGGTLLSGDGQLALIVPAGALTTATTIGIAAIANTAPGGTGFGYRLTPDGLAFAKPVTLTLTPTYGQLGGSTLEHVKLTFQDAQKRWQLIPVTADAGSKTVSATTTHFTDYAFLLDLALSGNDALFAGTATTLHVVELHTTSDGYAGTVGTAATGNPVWLLDGTALGNGSDGKLDVIGNAAAYTAPAQIPQTNPVSVSVAFTATGGSKVTLVQDLHILAHAYTFQVSLTNNPTCTGGSGYAYQYGTTATAELDLDADFAITSSNPSAATTPTISAITVCVTGACTATGEPAKTTGLSLTTVTGGWEPAVHRLRIQPRGTASGSPSFLLDCGAAGSHESLANAAAWNTPGYAGFLEGKNGETASQRAR